MAIGLDLELPNDEGRGWLLDGLTRLIRQRGFEKFLAGPVLLPMDEHFPDLVEPGPKGARTLLRRLGAYAGLGELGARVTVYERDEHAEFDHHGVGHGGAGAAAWFAGIHEGVAEYGVERRELRDPEELIGILGHEVAHAFREHHALAVVTRGTEEKLTDLTAVYLGFGVFLLNASHSFKTGGYSETGERLLFEKKMRGYLSPPELALLLGAQAIAREASKDERRAIGRALSPNHAKLFEDACRLFANDVFDLCRRLGVPEPDARAKTLRETAPLPLLDESSSSGGIVEKTASKRASRALRLVRHRGSTYGVLGAGAPVVFAATGLVEGWTLLGAVGLGAVLGFVWGRNSRDDRCSGCGERLGPGDERCPSCHASLVGRASSDEERLAAEEALEPVRSDYDYFADHAVSDEEKVEARLLTAIYTEWVLRRGLVSPAFRDQHPDVIERANRGELATAELFEIWEAYSELQDETGAAFSDAYFENGGQWNLDDYRLLTTANRIRDTRAGYARVQALLDRSFDAWKSSSA